MRGMPLHVYVVWACVTKPRLQPLRPLNITRLHGGLIRVRGHSMPQRSVPIECSDSGSRDDAKRCDGARRACMRARVKCSACKGRRVYPTQRLLLMPLIFGVYILMDAHGCLCICQRDEQNLRAAQSTPEAAADSVGSLAETSVRLSRAALTSTLEGPAIDNCSVTSRTLHGIMRERAI